jgi:hypothetical protein
MALARCWIYACVHALLSRDGLTFFLVAFECSRLENVIVCATNTVDDGSHRRQQCAPYVIQANDRLAAMAAKTDGLVDIGEFLLHETMAQLQLSLFG